MAAGGSSAEPEPLGALGARAHGPGPPGPGGPAAGDSPGGGVGGGAAGPPGPGPRGPCALAPKAPKGSGSALEPPAAMYFHKKGIEIRYNNLRFGKTIFFVGNRAVQGAGGQETKPAMFLICLTTV